MAHAILLWLLIFPLLLALGWMLLASRGMQRIKYLGASLLLAASGLLALLASNFPQPAGALCLFSHPSAGPMCVLPEPSSLRLCALLYLMLAALIAVRYRSLSLGPLQAAFLFASLSAGCLALVSEHFLLRYIALHLSAIWFLLELFLALRGEDAQLRRSISSFINLSVGDIGLLIAFFLLFSASNSFIISRSLGAAMQLNLFNQVLAAGGLLLAAWVKLGAWPLNWWARIGERLHASLFSWFCRLQIPLLGGYLLYLSAHFIRDVPNLASWLLLAASLFALYSALIPIFQTAYHDSILANQSYSACLLLVLAGAGLGQQILPSLASFLLARLIIDFLHHPEQHFDDRQCGPLTKWLLWARMLELLLFIPLIMLSAHTTPQGLWTLLLWVGFGLQFLLTAGKIDLHFLALEGKVQALRPAARTVGLMLLSTMGAFILHHLTRLWLVSGHIIWQPHPLRQYFAVFPRMLTGLLCAAVIMLVIKITQKSTGLTAFLNQPINFIHRLTHKPDGQEKIRDVLDPTPAAAQIHHSFLDFLYTPRDPIDQYPLFMRGFEKFIRFSFERVEQSTSVEIWRSIQNMLFSAAHRVQQLHTGKIRQNLIWVVVMLMILLVLYFTGQLDIIDAYG